MRYVVVAKPRVIVGDEWYPIYQSEVYNLSSGLRVLNRQGKAAKAFRHKLVKKVGSRTVWSLEYIKEGEYEKI